jgi:dTDP-4-dehydrorhamnose reductase
VERKGRIVSTPLIKPCETPRILVIGRIGQVGWELRRTLAPLGRLTCVDFPEIDLTNADSIRKWVRDTAPTVIVNAAAYTAVDKAETEFERCNAINGIAPGLLAEEAKKLGALLVHYSTDYVFDGTKSTGYVEEDAPNPLGAYGRSKLAGDRAVQQVGGAHLIFRLCWVYGARGQNFMLTMMRLMRERETLRVVRDQIGCPTWSRMISETTALALKQVLAAAAPGAYTGVYHLAATGQTSWHGFAEAILALMPAEGKKCQSVLPIPSSEYPLPAKRPEFSVLSCGKLKRTFGLELPGWKESLERVLEGGN